MQDITVEAVVTVCLKITDEIGEQWEQATVFQDLPQIHKGTMSGGNHKCMRGSFTSTHQSGELVLSSEFEQYRFRSGPIVFIITV